ncbi:hypothetical protein VNO78_05813 [Psophocarpus tetragonolobus]|uniref:RAB6-interacting golgin n=1 Tax=Psophocarpus tetragonolobus TaxID=3891 RepID=A0AAN9XR62_PSOTE
MFHIFKLSEFAQTTDFSFWITTCSGLTVPFRLCFSVLCLPDKLNVFLCSVKHLNLPYSMRGGCPVELPVPQGKVEPSFQEKEKKNRERKQERAGLGEEKSIVDFGAIMATPKQSYEEQQQQPNVQRVRNSGMVNSNLSPMRDDKEEEMSRSALAMFRAKEEEIERKKMEVRDKVHAYLGRVEEETKRLAEIRGELEGLTDPLRKEVAIVRKKIDNVNKELKPLGQTCQRKEREYKEALDAFNEKNKEKAQLVTKLMELVTESERLRMKKLEELSKNIDTLH